MKRALSVKDIETKRWKFLPWSGEWLAAFGTPALNATWFVTGKSASGKSSFVMQLAKELCNYGKVLYLSYEEGVSLSFQQRLGYLHMKEVRGRFCVVTSDSFDELVARLARPKSPRIVIVDSIQMAGFTYKECAYLRDRFKTKCFVFVSMEYNGGPMGKVAGRLRYLADVKVRVMGFRAYCQGRSIGEGGASYIVWKEGVIQTTNNLEK